MSRSTNPCAKSKAIASMKTKFPILGLLLGCCLFLCLGSQKACAQSTLVKIQGKAEGFSLPLVLTISSTNITTLFSTNQATSLGRILLRTVQNTGTNACLYTIGVTNVSGTNYHGVLAGGSALRDGLGSILNLQHVPWPVSFTTESGTTTIAAIELTQ
jgi:hypothetical protein